MKTIQVLLTESVDNLGIVGDVVKVRPGYARNFLLPRNMATQPTKGAIARLAERRAEVEREMALRRAELVKVLEKLEGFELTMQRSHNEQGVLYGSVSQHDLAEALRAEGLPIEDRMVRVGDQIKRLDTYEIPIVLANDLKTEIKVWVVTDRAAEELEGDEQGEEQTEEAGEEATA
jgi:large subunit ribosomal protein L9